MSADSGTGLTHIGAREYDPSTGQFISVDPLLTLDQHQSLSGYVYANNNPTTFSDPSGLGVDDGTGHSEPHHGRGSGNQSPTPGIPAGGTGPGGCYHQCGASSNGASSESDSGVIGANRDSVRYAQEQIYAAVSDLAATPEQREAWLGAYRSEMQKQYESGWMVDANTAIAEATNVCFVYKEIGCSQEMKDYFEDVENTRVQGVGSYESAFVDAAVQLKVGKTDLGRALSARSCKCFLAGTDVLMADGATKDIEDIQLGDKVLSTDPETGKSGSREVTRLIVTDDDKHFNELSLATEDGVEKLTATHEHPFWSPSEKRWIEARHLAPGTTLLTGDGDPAIVTANRSFTKRARTFNLTVEGLHTYYVLAGETPVLVHNSNCNLNTLTRAQSDDIAKYLGYTKTKKLSAGKTPIWENKKAGGGQPKSITFDRTGHNKEAVFKGSNDRNPFQSTKDSARDGTYGLDIGPNGELRGLEWLKK